MRKTAAREGVVGAVQSECSGMDEPLDMSDFLSLVSTAPGLMRYLVRDLHFDKPDDVQLSEDGKCVLQGKRWSKLLNDVIRLVRQRGRASSRLTVSQSAALAHRA